MIKKHQGYIPTPTSVYGELEQMYGSMDFGNVRKTLMKDLPKLVTNYKAVTKFVAGAFGDDAQKLPDCTSHATRNAADISRGVEIVSKGEFESFEARGATEAIYRYRSGRAGMNPGRATQFCIQYGLLLRQDYRYIDLTKYNPNWANPRGIPAWTATECRKHPCNYFLRIKNTDDALLAMANGYGLHCGSQYGNNGVRDKNGVSKWNDSWNHDMAWGGYFIDHKGDVYIIVLQSWGNWNRGGHPEFGQLPNGAFLIPLRDAARMITSGECWAVGDVTGWALRDLPDYGFGEYL